MDDGVVHSDCHVDTLLSVEIEFDVVECDTIDGCGVWRTVDGVAMLFDVVDSFDVDDNDVASNFEMILLNLK